ncbi:hypothetical protein WA026_023160 [Henosepilachna vigintioctopunctata]|uniref:Uncharacterized protein n=1 Tax=Henosepilachna vigintioctopunctata TaxID=420089 RepID=A0AAW1TYV3_9CUCU
MRRTCDCDAHVTAIYNGAANADKKPNENRPTVCRGINSTVRFLPVQVCRFPCKDTECTGSGCPQTRGRIAHTSKLGCQSLLVVVHRHLLITADTKLVPTTDRLMPTETCHYSRPPCHTSELFNTSFTTLLPSVYFTRFTAILYGRESQIFYKRR